MWVQSLKALRTAKLVMRSPLHFFGQSWHSTQMGVPSVSNSSRVLPGQVARHLLS